MKNQNLSPTLWTKKDTSYFLRCSVKTVDRLLRDGRIEGFKFGRKVLIYPDTVTEENINAIKPKFI
jgi:hypothetical protein